MKLFFCLILVIGLGGCGKSVDLHNPDNTNITTPTGGNGGGTGGVGVTPINNTPQTKTETLIFANHGEPGTSEMNYSEYRFSKGYSIVLPSGGIFTSYNAKDNKADLTLYMNNAYVCTYKWDGKKFVPHQSCVLSFKTEEGDVFVVTGMPQGQTVILSTIFKSL